MASATDTWSSLRRAHAAVANSVEASLRNQGALPMPRIELLLLLEQGPLTVGELAKRLSLHQAHISRVVDALERDQLVSKERSSEDKRVWFVTITKDGERRLQAALPLYTAAVEAAFVDLAPRTLTQVAAALNSVQSGAD